MTAVTYRDGVAILQVVVFVPTLALAIVLCLRHGFKKSSGWVLLITFSLLRLIGAICQLVAINNPSTGVITAAIVCISIGLSPLTLLCLGLLSRVSTSAPRPIPPIAFKLIGILSLAGIIVGIYGGVRASSAASPSSSNPTPYYVTNSESKTAVVLFTVVYLITMAIFLYLASQTRHVATGDKRLLLAVALSAPFLAVRLSYALVSDFAQDPRFNSYFGDVTLYLCMAVLEEIVVVGICVAVGLTLKKLPRWEAEGPVPVGRQMSGTTIVDGRADGGMMGGQTSGVVGGGGEDPVLEAEKGQGQYTQSNRRAHVAQPPPVRSSPRRARGPITMLYGYGKDYYESRKTQQPN